MAHGKPMVLRDQVYNGRFLLTQTGDFPDGWLKVGGDESTVWEWWGVPPGRRAVVIRNPSQRPAGIFQPTDVGVCAGELQRWKVSVEMSSEPPSVPAYLKIYFFTFDGKPVGISAYELHPGATPEKFGKVFATPSDTEVFSLEVGVAGEGVLWIHSVAACRLHPCRVLRLDSKGRPFVNSVETIGEILKPVRLAEPLPVHIQADVKADLRDLTPLRDGVRLYGSNGLPINAAPSGALRVETSGCGFLEFTEEMRAFSDPSPTSPRDVSRYRYYSFAVFNEGPARAFVGVEVSPDAVHWVQDSALHRVDPEGMVVVTGTHFLRYVRLLCSSELSSDLRIWFQAQA
ncbi:MAG: DUF6385 domain-containing protein [Thermacetogeniaceae bacterium]